MNFQGLRIFREKALVSLPQPITRMTFSLFSIQISFLIWYEERIAICVKATETSSPKDQVLLHNEQLSSF